MTQPPKALIFDLDGVLIDSEPLHRKTWISSLQACGVTLAQEDEPHLQGRTAEQVVQWLVGTGRADEIDLEKLILLKRESFRESMQDGLRAVPGGDAFLRAQRPLMPLGLVTSARLKLVGQIMLLFNWRNIFSALVGADHVANVKPHPEPYLHGAERLKVRPADCLVFEDSAVGVEAARKAGARVCGVATTLAPSELKSAGARFVIRDFTDEAGLRRALAGEAAKGPFHWIRERIAR